MQAMSAANGLYSVTYGAGSFVMDLNVRTCSCEIWELRGIPYYHALAVMRDERLSLLNFFHDYYSTEYSTPYGTTMPNLLYRDLFKASSPFCVRI